MDKSWIIISVFIALGVSFIGDGVKRMFNLSPYISFPVGGAFIALAIYWNKITPHINELGRLLNLQVFDTTNPFFIVLIISASLLFFLLVLARTSNDVPRKQKLLAQLESLADDPCFKPNRCFDKDACVKWANSVEVLLKGNSNQYREWVVHRTTMLQTHDLFDGMGYLVDRMKNILDLAIKELKEKLT